MMDLPTQVFPVRQRRRLIETSDVAISFSAKIQQTVSQHERGWKKGDEINEGIFVYYSMHSGANFALKV